MLFQRKVKNSLKTRSLLVFLFLFFFSTLNSIKLLAYQIYRKVTVVSGTLAFVQFENCGSFLFHIRQYAHAHFDFYGNKQYGGQRGNIVQT